MPPTTVPVQLGDSGSINTWPVFVFAIGLLIMGVLTVRKVAGGLLIGIVITTVLAIIIEAVAKPGDWALNTPKLPDSIGGLPDLSSWAMSICSARSANTAPGARHLRARHRRDDPAVHHRLVQFLRRDGHHDGPGQEAGLADENGTLPDIGKALAVEGTGAIAGGLGSASSSTVFVESASGIAEGARARAWPTSSPASCSSPRCSSPPSTGRALGGSRPRTGRGRRADDRADPHHRLHPL